MSLISAINKSVSGLNVAQLGLQVVGNNIANANTPGYIRQELVQAPGLANRQGDLLIGSGVRPVGIRQTLDNALAERLRDATSALAANDTLGSAQTQLEALVNELGDADLSTQLSSFNSSLHDLANQPGDYALKQQVILEGQTLADHVRRLNDGASQLADAADASYSADIEQVNILTSKIASLNRKIVDIEGGRTLGSDATGLRDEREMALNELSGYLDIDSQEQASGAVAVFVGGDFLVTDGISRDVYSTNVSKDPTSASEIRIVETNAPLQINGGKLGGISEAREGIYGKFISDLDSIAAGIAESFNRIHSQGKGTAGFTDLTSVVGVTPDVSLDQAGLDFTPENGSFELQLFGETNEPLSSHRIDIDLFSNGNGTTLADVAAQISAIDGVQGSITPDGHLTISATTPGVKFGFGNDTSGFLAAAGINTFFTGNDAASLNISEKLLESPEYLAISAEGIGTDADHLTDLVDLFEKPLPELGNISVRDRYQRLVTTITQGAAIQQSVTDGLRTYHSALEGDYLSVTSVNIDEEAVKMVYLQRAFQASSRVISTATEMLELLVSL
ncbi:Flagellar hook-associated protein 1 [Rosistilla oblonga]|uniref:Flagellar hook-associated protein 1 n=1 Tax=Rosistilla oblonga TaxID=2527990 RepID=A0A518ISF1_9BACT|nr:flagellar hook-associated protein FlgK [Rosistilla oblonga]QDV11863.1 Flagellar hook-associated protein 1 [Rosistilla oblonga]QDV56014.1 Flagellar hook-associated protein 1 [Rosistilla oblonga]